MERNELDDHGEKISIHIMNDQLLLRLHDNDDHQRNSVYIPNGRDMISRIGRLIEFRVGEDEMEPALTAMKVYEFRQF